MAEIRAEIAANVWQVVAEEGQMVAEGDEICILESMKMEIPVITEVPGVVRELHVERAGGVRRPGDDRPSGASQRAQRGALQRPTGPDRVGLRPSRHRHHRCRKCVLRRRRPGATRG
jgi:acetyl-CoA carboxylase biotin carboxyl carrier protein